MYIHLSCQSKLQQAPFSVSLFELPFLHILFQYLKFAGPNSSP